MTTMVGEETEFVVTADNADRDQKEIKKTGLINAFFHPVKAKQNTETTLTNETPLSTKNESSQATESSVCARKTKTATVLGLEATHSVIAADSQTSKKKTSNLSGKAFLHHASSQEELLKPKKPKPKWSVTCAVRNSTRNLNSSDSDFEDDGKGAFDIKTKQMQKSGKKKAKDGSRNNGRNGHEIEGNISESTDNSNKESKIVQIEKSNDLSKHVIEKDVKQDTEEVKPQYESKALGKCEKTNQTRTTAFDVLMKSQRAQKLEDQRTETSLVEASDTAIASSHSKSEILDSCEIDDNKGAPQSKLPASTGDSSSETNAFDFLMRKGRLGKSPTSIDSQQESDLESKVLNPEKIQSKKKSFEFKLSIRASKNKDIEFSLESDYASSDAVNCEEQSKLTRKRKTRKLKSVKSKLNECGNDESSGSEVSKSKRGQKKTKVKSKANNEEDQADVSLLEVTAIKESNKNDKKGRKSGRKCSSVTEKVTGIAVSNEGDEIDCQPHIRGKRTNQQRKDNENTSTGIKDKKIQRPKKKMKSGVTSISQGSLSAECQQLSVCDSSNNEDAGRSNREGDEKKQKVLPSESLSITESQTTSCSTQNKEDSEREIGTRELYHKETSLCTTAFVPTESKTLASIFLKRKPVNPKPGSEEQFPTVAEDLSTVSSKESLDNATKECSTSDLDSSLCKAKSVAEQEAANRAFKALFTGACSQKMFATSTAAEAFPAPWPLVSHVIQRDEDSSPDVNFWNLPWPVGNYHKSDEFSHNLSLDGLLADVLRCTSFSLTDRMMFWGKVQKQEQQSLCDSKKLGSGTTQQNFSEAVTKKVLLELALFYPGVPLRKLYKRYASKLVKHKELSAAVESKQVCAENTAPVSDRKSHPKPFDDNEEKHDLVSKVKRRLSSDGDVSKKKKVARKSEQSPASLPCQGQDLLKDQSVNKSCKKRGREEENDQGQEKGTKERRLSTRLQKKKISLECESVDDDLEQVEATSNRKKRRRTMKDVKQTSGPSVEQGKSTEKDVPVTSNKEKNSVDGFVSDTLWTDFFCPLHSTEVMANASAVSKLRTWLEEWKVKREKTLRKELQQQKRLLAKQKGKLASGSQASNHTLDWWDNDSDSDFQMSDNASDDSDTEGVGLNTAMFISGPTGVGKTAMVYACAEELGYKVFEVNSSSKRSGKHILSQLEEATQSHLVINNKGPTPQSSFAGLFNKPMDNSSPASGPLGAFFNTNANASDAKTKKGEKGKKKLKMKETKKDVSKGKGRSILKQPPQAVNDDTESCSSLSSKAASLILFEEVDVIFEEDKSFWMAVNSFMQNAKCPIVLISTESQVSCEGRFEQINLKPPSINLLAAHLQLVALTNNMFVSPEDLKSIVAQNNCDIRKSFLALQFWSVSGGGVKMPYDRSAANLQDKDVADKCQKPHDVSAICNSNTDHGKADFTSSQDVLQIEPPVTSGILNDDGEESMFLSLSDWQVIKNRGTRRSSRATRRGSLVPIKDDNSDSDFCDSKKKTLVCTYGTTDSIFEITDTNDSQPVSSADQKAEESLQLPLMDSLLFESSRGLLNCVADPTVGSLSVLQNKKKPGGVVEDCVQSSKLHLTQFTQGLDVNLVQANLSDLIPFFADSSTSSAQAQNDPPKVEGDNSALPVTGHVEFKCSGIFSDKSLFDDGMVESGNNVEHDCVMETNQMTEKESDDIKARPVPSSQDSTDTGFSESQPKEEIGEVGRSQGDGERNGDSAEKGRKLARKKPSNEERCCTKALEIFAQFAENMSFSDAFCPSLSVSNTQSTSAEFGWWHAALKPGLTDEHVTRQECSDWLARDTRASLRGALEVANLESCRVKVNYLVEDLKHLENSTQGGNTSTALESEQCDFKFLSEDLPPCDSNGVLRFDEITRTQKSSMASRRKLHSSLGSCIPALYHCDHRCVASDYIPAFRLLCHSERLREAANIKRRFLHYLDLNSFPLSRSSMEGLADSYLAK